MARAFLVAVLALVAIAIAPPPARAQTPTPPLGEIARASLDALPGRPSEVRFLRITLPPGAALPAEGSTVWRLAAVERGALTVTGDRPLPFMSNAGTATPAPARTIVVAAGAWTLLPPGATIAARNDGMEPVSLLLLVLSWGDASPAAGPSPAAGVASQLIAAANVVFGIGPGELSIARAALDPGKSRDQLALASIELGGIEQGRATIAVTAGQILLRPGAMTGAPGAPRTVVTGATATVSAGDGYVVPASSRVTWTVSGSDALVSLEASVATRPR